MQYVFDFGRLRELRRAKKMRQVDVAERMGCSPSHLSKIELGEMTATVDDLARLASIYEETNIADFFVRRI